MEGGNNEQVMDIFQSNSNNKVRSNTATQQSYEQVSTKQILRQIREKNTGSKGNQKNRDGGALEEEEYFLEAPKSGLFNRTDVVPPLFLPTHCETTESLERKSTSNTAEAKDTKVKSVTKEVIFCIDKIRFEKIFNTANKDNKKSHWGLTFESDFECGNLYQAESIFKKGAPLNSPEEYDLYLNCDPKDSIQKQFVCNWFLFRVQNTKKRSYRFHVHYLSNPNSNYKRGMKIYMLSEQDYVENRRGELHEWYLH